ncbi:MAG TPA: DUF4214 domain-containing protein [Pyrinomonadaceae bacterium]|nr:DUF4214 domain-containing protein [Pyrinomonadaceae bacterium]
MIPRLNTVALSLVPCLLALLLLPLFSSSSAKLRGPLNNVASMQAVAADGYCMLSPLSLQERTAASALIVEGEVVSQESFWDAPHYNIYTRNLINVYKVFKGNVSSTQIEIVTEGGTVGLQKQVTTPALALANGEMGVFFCEPSAIIDPLKQTSAQSFVAYGSVQGFIHYNLAEGTASEPFRIYSGIESELYDSIIDLTRSAPREVAANLKLAGRATSESNLAPTVVPTLSSFSPTTITAGTDQVLTIVGTGFGATQGTGFVEFNNADNGGATLVKPLATDYVSWTDIEIKVQVPTRTIGAAGTAGTGTIKVTNSDPASVTSAGTLTIEYAYSNVGDTGTSGVSPQVSQMPDHVNANGSGGYTFTMDTGEFTPTTADDAFLRAMNTWTCASGINWTTTTGAIDTIAKDGTNAVRFDDGAELPAGVLGRATSWYDGCAITAGYFTWQVSEIDVAFNDATTWQFGPAAPGAGQVDFESVALHELGHGHQLGHVISAGAVMHFSIGAGDNRRVLSGADQAAGRYIQSRSVVANICGTGPMISATGTGCAPTAAPAILSGQITTADGRGVPGVTVTLSGGRFARTITDSNGNYRFLSVETDNFYTVTPSLVNYHFLPGDRSFSLLGAKTDAVFTAEPDATIIGNAIDSPDFFVRQHYVDFLGREPDESGFNFWSEQINSCGLDVACVAVKRINVSAAYFLSIEFQATGGVVDGLYRASYGRRPTYAEFMPDVALIGQNVIVGEGDWNSQLESNRQAFIAAWVNRTAFKAAYDNLSNGDYVDALISHTTIGVSQSERNDLVTALLSGALTRGEVLTRIVDDQRFIAARRNETFVMMEYFGYLRRDPDEAGYQYWLNKLNQFDGNFERAEMVRAFLVSSEYRARFQR